MSAKNSKNASRPLRTALLLALALPGAVLVSGCNKPADPPPGEVATPPAETPPPAIDTPPADMVPTPATDPTSTPPTDPNAPPAAEPSTPPTPADSDGAPQ